MKKHTTIIAIFLIFLVSSFFKFYKLSDNPTSLSMDEVSIGYNAYSLIKTGQDEWAMKWPLSFKSTGDHKPPVNVYLTIPSILLFGLNKFSIRLPTALIGTFLPIIFFLLLKQLNLKTIPSLLSSLWLATSPWANFFSRAGFEAVTALTFLVFATYLLLSYFRSPKTLKLVASIIFYSLSVWAYHTERLFTPIIFLTIIYLYKSKLRSIPKKDKILSVLTLSIFALPFIYLSFFTTAISARIGTTILTKDPVLNQAIKTNYTNLTQKIFNNHTLQIFRFWTGKYLNYFDPKYIFGNGLSLTSPQSIGVGLLHLIDFPFIIIGIVALIKLKNSNFKTLALVWLLSGPLVASLTINEQHPLRSFNWIIAFGFLIYLAFRSLGQIFKYKQIIAVYIVLLAISSVYFFNAYINHFPYFKSEFWQYGYKQLSQYACQNINKYRQIKISDTYGSWGPTNTGLPYLYVLVHCQYEPQKFLQDNRNIDKISFQRPNWKFDKHLQNTLLIGTPWDFLDIKEVPSQNILKEIKFKNGITAFYIIETKPFTNEN